MTAGAHENRDDRPEDRPMVRGRQVAQVKQIVGRGSHRRQGRTLLRPQFGGAVAHGKHRKLHAIGDAELAIDATEVVFHGLGPETHPGRRLPVRTSHRDERHDLTFTSGEMHGLRRPGFAWKRRVRLDLVRGVGIVGIMRVTTRKATRNVQ